MRAFMDTGFIDALLKISRDVKGEKKMTKTVLIVAAAAVFLVYGFVLWCCIKVGAESEKEYMKLAEKRGKEQQCDK